MKIAVFAACLMLSGCMFDTLNKPLATLTLMDILVLLFQLWIIAIGCYVLWHIGAALLDAGARVRKDPFRAETERRRDLGYDK